MISFIIFFGFNSGYSHLAASLWKNQIYTGETGVQLISSLSLDLKQGHHFSSYYASNIWTN